MKANSNPNHPFFGNSGASSPTPGVEAKGIEWKSQAEKESEAVTDYVNLLLATTKCLYRMQQLEKEFPQLKDQFANSLTTHFNQRGALINEIEKEENNG